MAGAGNISILFKMFKKHLSDKKLFAQKPEIRQ